MERERAADDRAAGGGGAVKSARIAIDGRKIADFGIGTYIRGLLAGLAEIAGPERYVVLAPSGAEGIPPGFEHVISDSPGYSARELFQVGRQARRAGAGLLHEPHYVLPFSSGPAIVTIHDLIHLHVRHRNPAAAIYARVMIGRAVRLARRILTVSEAVKAEIVETFRCDAARITVTPNGIDDFFHVSRPNLSPERYFLLVGNDKPHKNVDRLVAAFARVQAAAPDLTLVLAGGAFETFRGREGVTLAGFVSREELRRLYRNALALVQPSIEEGFGLPAAEAMASGTAVIISKAAALLEVTGGVALATDALSIESMASAMSRLARDESLRLDLGRRGIQRARAMTWRRCAEATRNAYQDVLRITF